MESSFAPFGVFGVSLSKKLKLQGILFSRTFSFELEMGRGEFDLLIDYIHEMNLHKDTFFTLCPLGDWMSA